MDNQNPQPNPHLSSQQIVLPPSFETPNPPHHRRKRHKAHLEIPRWFVVLFTGGWCIFMACFVPWAVWVSLQIMTILIRLEATNSIQTDVTALKTALQTERSDFDNLKERVVRLEEIVKRNHP